MPNYGTRKRAQSFRLNYRNKANYCILKIYNKHFHCKNEGEQISAWDSVKKELIQKTSGLDNTWEGFAHHSASLFYYITGYRSGSSAFLHMLQKEMSNKDKWTAILIDPLRVETSDEKLFSNTSPWQPTWQSHTGGDNERIVENIKTSIKQFVEAKCAPGMSAMFILDHLDVWLLRQWRDGNLTSVKVWLLRRAWAETMNDYNIDWKTNNGRICFVATLMIPVHYSLDTEKKGQYNIQSTSTILMRDIWSENCDVYKDGGFQFIFSKGLSNYADSCCRSTAIHCKCPYCFISSEPSVNGVIECFEEIYEVCKGEPWLMISILAWAQSTWGYAPSTDMCASLDLNVKTHYMDGKGRNDVPLIDDFLEGLALYIAKYAREDCKYVDVKDILEKIKGDIITKIKKNKGFLNTSYKKASFARIINRSWKDTFRKCVDIKLLVAYKQKKSAFLDNLIDDIMVNRGILINTMDKRGKTRYQINPGLCYLHSDCRIFNIGK